MTLAALVGFVLGGVFALVTPKSSSLLALVVAVPLSFVAELVFGGADFALVKGTRHEKALTRVALWAGIVIGCLSLWHFG